MKKLLLLVLIAMIGIVPAMTGKSEALAADVPILWVHGLQGNGTCPSVDSVAQAAPFKNVMQRHSYSGTIVPIDYYCGDTTGVSIRGAGGPSTAKYPQNGYTQDTPIERIGLDLAWYIYNAYTIHGQAVSLAAPSMGGLISMYAVTHVGTAEFPPALLIQDVVTFSTPFGGVDKPTIGTPAQYVSLVCGGSKTQCNEMIPGSPFLVELASRPIPASIDITTMGGGPLDIISYASSSATQADHKVNFNGFFPMAYDHAGYITDQSAAQDMPAEVAQGNGSPVKYTGGMPHSLEWSSRSFTLTTW